MPVHDLGLVEETREVLPGAPESRTTRHFLDFTIDGNPLYPRVRVLGFDLITEIWIRNTQATACALEAIDRLLGVLPPDAPGDRVSVYRCAECGGLGCGALTIELKLTDTEARWESWGHQNDYDGELWQDEAVDLPTMRFERAQYEHTLREVRRQLAQAG